MRRREFITLYTPTVRVTQPCRKHTILPTLNAR
jgi:hypothetical protein